MQRVPPHNLDAESSLIGGILLSGAIPPDVEIRPEWFYRGAHRVIFSTMLGLDAQGEPIDSVSLNNALRERKKLDDVGGASYIAHLMDLTPSLTSESLANYARIIKEKAVRRSTISLLHGAMEMVTDEEQPIEEVIARISSELTNVEYCGTNTHFTDMRTLVKDGIRRIEARTKHPNYVSGAPTPFVGLNKLTNGLQDGDLIVLAGRPSMGKSAIAQQIAEHVAQAGPVAIFTLEMDADSLADRSLSSRAKIPSQLIQSGHLKAEDWTRLVHAAGDLAELPILANDSPSLTAQQIRFLARQAKARMKGLALVTIDYLQLIRSDRREKQRYLEIGETTRTMKALARELKVPVLLLSQLNRSCESRENKRPLLSDLRESGDIEQDADLVLLLYQDQHYCQFCAKGKKSECTKGHAGLAEVNIAKNRKGPTGTVSLVWQAQYTRFEDRAHE